MKLNIQTSKSDVAHEFSNFFVELIRSQPLLHIALSGGSTPKIVFDALAANYKNSIDWEKVHFYWGDERCVPPTDDESNYKMTFDHLLSKIKIPKENVHRIKGENPPTYEAGRYARIMDKKMPKSNQCPQFDLVILGMGDDGHTASIFPEEIQLWAVDSYCVVATHPETGQQRISLTGRIINNAKTVAFLVTGESKAEKVREIIRKEGQYKAYPAFLVAPSSGNLQWFLDHAAAAGIMTN